MWKLKYRGRPTWGELRLADKAPTARPRRRRGISQQTLSSSVRSFSTAEWSPSGFHAILLKSNDMSISTYSPSPVVDAGKSLVPATALAYLAVYL
jgi:hypothetical protein